MSECLQILADKLKMKIFAREPLTPFDKIIDRFASSNKDFAKTYWHFPTDSLKRILGDQFQPFTMTEPQLRFILDCYIDSLRQKRENRGESSNMLVNSLRLLGYNINRRKQVLTVGELVSLLSAPYRRGLNNFLARLSFNLK